MTQFDITLENIILRVYCDTINKEIITKLMTGHAYITNTNNDPTYSLVIDYNNQVNYYDYYISMVDVWFDNATCDIYIDNENKIVYMKNIKASETKWKNSLIQYFTCNLFNRLLEENGYYSFHSSCVEKNNTGLIFMGPRNSGKTNCMLNLMNKGYNSVTNDKIAMAYINNQINCYGVAQDVSIRMSESFTSQIRNEKYVSYAKNQNIPIKTENMLEGNNIHLFSSELAKLNNVKQIPLTIAKAIFCPIYDSTIKQTYIEEIPSKEKLAILLLNEMALVHPTTNFLKLVTTKHTTIDKMDILLKISQLDFYNITQGENSYDNFEETIKQRIRK